MVPTLYASFFADGPALHEKAKEVALAQGYAIVAEDADRGVIHLHKKQSGKTVHLNVYLGGKSERSIAVQVIPGDEGRYMDFGRNFIDGLRKAVR